MRTVVTTTKLRHVTDVLTIDYQNLSDEELMMGYSRGDAASFDELYRRNKGPLYRYFLRQTSQVPLSEELTHDVWLRVINSRQRYLPNAKFTTFIFHIAHNCMVDHYRKFSRSQQMDCGEHLVDDVPSDDGSNPEVQVHRAQAKKVLMSLLMQLPAEQRETFVLKEESNLSIDEIAKVINENPETIKSRLRYAMKKLKSGLQEYMAGK